LSACFFFWFAGQQLGYGDDLTVQENPFFFQESIGKLFFTER
jgi:hypothetical protein